MAPSRSRASSALSPRLSASLNGLMPVMPRASRRTSAAPVGLLAAGDCAAALTFHTSSEASSAAAGSRWGIGSEYHGDLSLEWRQARLPQPCVAPVDNRVTH